MRDDNILVISDWFLPGFKAGGPIRSVANLIEHLSNEYIFSVVTRDRDLGAQIPYKDIKPNNWNCLNNANVLYLAPRETGLKSLLKVMRVTPHNRVYLNSFFSYKFSISPLILRRIGLLPNVPYLVAPRGQFSMGALEIKKWKKRIFISLARFAGLYNDVVWHATSDQEAQDIRQVFGNNMKIIVAANLPPKLTHAPPNFYRDKSKGLLRAALLARVSPMKNIDGALEILRGCRANIEFNIYGPKEDLDYWRRCQEIIETLPENITVTYRGQVEHEAVANVFTENDILFLPTLGENFGHAIYEAFASGCPVLISDRTPWRNLEAEGVGWDIPLHQPERFSEVLDMCADMTNEEFSDMSKRAFHFVSQNEKVNKSIQDSRKLFNQVS